MTVLVPGRNLVLVGMMGAGKTTVGRILAERLDRPFADTDAVVEAGAGAAVHELFAARGERVFRELEAEAVRRVSTLRGQVVAVGGGAVMAHANVTHLRATGDLVHLRADAATLAARLDDTDPAVRPLLAGAEDPVVRLKELLAERAITYERVSAHVVDTAAKAPEDVAEEILEWARRRPGLLSREELGQ